MKSSNKIWLQEMILVDLFLESVIKKRLKYLLTSLKFGMESSAWSCRFGCTLRSPEIWEKESCQKWLFKKNIKNTLAASQLNRLFGELKPRVRYFVLRWLNKIWIIIPVKKMTNPQTVGSSFMKNFIDFICGNRCQKMYDFEFFLGKYLFDDTLRVSVLRCVIEANEHPRTRKKKQWKHKIKENGWGISELKYIYLVSEYLIDGKHLSCLFMLTLN